MANPDRAGLKPVRSATGLTSWDLSFAEPYLIDLSLFEDTEASAIAVGAPVAATATANALTGDLGHLRGVIPLTDEHDAGSEGFVAEEAPQDIIAGVVVGISRIGDMTTFNTANAFGQFMAGPNDLGISSKYVTSAEVEAASEENLSSNFLVWVAAADEWLFEGQIESAGSVRKGDMVKVSVGDDGTDESVDTATGRSKCGWVLATELGQGIVTHVPRYIDNDAEAADARVWVRFKDSMTKWTGADAAGTDAGDATAT